MSKRAVQGVESPPPRAPSALAFLDHADTAVLDCAGLGALVVDPELRVLLWNAVMEQLSGMPRARMIGHKLDEVFPFFVGSQTHAAITAALSGQETTLPEQAFTFPETGRLGVSEARFSPIRSDERHIIGVFGVTRDITLRRPARFGATPESPDASQVADAMVAIAARYEALFGQAAVGIAQIRRSKQIVTANPRFCEMLGRSSAELQGARLDEFRHPDDESNRELLDTLFAEGRNYVVENRYTRPDGMIIWALTSVSPIFDETGKATLAAVMLQDITELKETQTRLEEALVEKEDLLHQKELLLREVNHRVKNSLQLVSSLLRLQAARTPDPSTASVFADAIGRVDAIAQLHEWLYKTSVSADIALGPYLSDLCLNLERSGSSTPEACRITVESDSIELPMDRAILLALVVNELTTNSIKYGRSADGTTDIRVTCRQDEDQVRVDVEDTGPGFPGGFDPWRSSGFGMTIVTRLTEQLDGAFQVGNAGPGAKASLAFPHRPDSGSARQS